MVPALDPRIRFGLPGLQTGSIDNRMVIILVGEQRLTTLAGACPRWNERKLQVIARMLQAVCDSLLRLMESSSVLFRDHAEIVGLNGWCLWPLRSFNLLIVNGYCF